MNANYVMELKAVDLMNKTKQIWGRTFNLPVVFDCYDGEDVTAKQLIALENFIDMKNIDDVVESVKKYCIEDKRNDNIRVIDNIFKYVVPKDIFVKRSETEIVALMCNYKFDEEHGLSVVFKGGKLWKIGPQDIML